MVMVVVTELHTLAKVHFTVCKSLGLRAKEKPDPANPNSSSYQPLSSFPRGRRYLACPTSKPLSGFPSPASPTTGCLSCLKRPLKGHLLREALQTPLGPSRPSQPCFSFMECNICPSPTTSLLSFKEKWKCELLSHVWLFVTPWTVACQAPLSMGFSRPEYWSRLTCLPPGDLPNPGIQPKSPALQVDSLPSESPGRSDKQCYFFINLVKMIWAQ